MQLPLVLEAPLPRGFVVKEQQRLNEPWSRNFCDGHAADPLLGRVHSGGHVQVRLSHFSELPAACDRGSHPVCSQRYTNSPEDVIAVYVEEF